MKKSSILKKMLVGISAPVILVLACSGFLISSKVRTTVTQQAKENLDSESAAASSQVSDFFTQYLSGASHAASSYQFETFIKSVSGKTRLNVADGYKEVKISLDKMAAVDPDNILAAWVGDFDTSQITQSDGYNSEDGWDITGRPWYRVKETRKPVLTEPYIDASTGQLIVSAAAPVFDVQTNEVIGAVGFDIKLEQLTSIMQTYKVGKEGFIILATDQGLVIHHPDSRYIQKQVSEVDWPLEVSEAFLNGFTGSMDYTMNGVKYSGSMNPVKSCGWYVLSGLPVSEIMETYYSSVTMIVTIFVSGLVILLVIIYLISKGISGPVKRLALIADRIAGGDLGVKVDVSTTDETGLVAAALDKTVVRLNQYIDYIDEISVVLDQIADSDLTFELKHDYAGEFAKIKTSILKIKRVLTNTMNQISQASGEVFSGSEHVAAGSHALSQGATQQASAVEELAQTISDISNQVHDNAMDSQEANQMVNQVSKDLVHNSGRMEELAAAMKEINHRSGEIGKVIKAIEDIAFQTNILALNAAVEAARAGESGKGFAVVADEVRNLAAKSAEAAKETTQLLEGSIQSMANGTSLAAQAAGETLSVAEKAKQAEAAIDRITQATNKQANAIGQVVIGVDQINSVVQNNSATAEESAAASQQLSGQAQVLKNLVGKFRF